QTQLFYNSDGTLASSTDANGKQTFYNSYDASGQPTMITDPVGSVTKIGYDVDGRIRSIQDPRHANSTGTQTSLYQTQFNYDSFHRLDQQSTPKQNGSKPLIWADTIYDANSNVVTQVGPHLGTSDVT